MLRDRTPAGQRLWSLRRGGKRGALRGPILPSAPPSRRGRKPKSQVTKGLLKGHIPLQVQDSWGAAPSAAPSPSSPLPQRTRHSALGQGEERDSDTACSHGLLAEMRLRGSTREVGGGQGSGRPGLGVQPGPGVGRSVRGTGNVESGTHSPCVVKVEPQHGPHGHAQSWGPCESKTRGPVTTGTPPGPAFSPDVGLPVAIVPARMRGSGPRACVPPTPGVPGALTVPKPPPPMGPCLPSTMGCVASHKDAWAHPLRGWRASWGREERERVHAAGVCPLRGQGPASLSALAP